MGFYDFEKDLEESDRSTKEEIIPTLERFGYKVLKTNDDKEFDIHVVTKHGEYLIEYKQDMECFRTGNVFVEFESREKPSGINTTKSDMYLYKIHTPDNRIIIHIAWTNTIKKWIDDNKLPHGSSRIRIATGGDPGSNTRGYVPPYEEYLKLGKIMLKIKL